MPSETIHGCRIYCGDNRVILPSLPHSSVHCVVTSPPYFNQRDYGNEKQIGLEKTPDDYVAELVRVFREVRMVMRRDATLWVNIGDKYANDDKWGGSTSGKHTPELHGHGPDRRKITTGMGSKNLLGVPWRFAFAMQADGWILRSDIIWHRTNAMPQSMHDRPSCNHEYLFLFAREPRYFYDDVAIREPGTDAKGRTKRSVWSIPVAAEKEQHFACFPPKLVEPCILAGTSSHGCCKACGAPYVRQVERDRIPTRPGNDSKLTGDNKVDGNRDKERHVSEVRTLGWEKSCKCPGDERKPAIVLDPFAGSFTSCATAVALNRRAVGIELNPEYVEIGKRKLGKSIMTQGFGLQ